MDRRIRLLGLTIVGTVLATSVGIASASPMPPTYDDWDPWDKVRAIYPDDLNSGTGRPYLGTAFQDSWNTYGSWIQGMRPDPDNPSNMIGGLCPSVDGAPCDTATLLIVHGAIPACGPDRQSNCVEGIYLREAEQVINGRPAGEWQDGSDTQFDEIPVGRAVPVPASGRASLWDLPNSPHEGGTLYLAGVTVDSTLVKSGGRWRTGFMQLSVDVVAVERRSGSFINGPCSRAVAYGPTEGQNCLVRHQLPNSSFGVRLRTGADFGSFIFGRVADPEISVSRIQGGVLLDVLGRPAPTPQAAIAVPARQAPGYVGWDGSPFNGAILFYNNSGSVGSLDSWRQWSATIGSRSDAIKMIWGFRTTNRSLGVGRECIPAGQLAGWISTNAMVYEAAPPTYDEAAGTLDFKVGGPALTPTGGLASADYDFFLRKAVAECVWPGRDLARVATVSVIDGGNGPEVTTTSVGNSGDWVTFTARNILFPKTPDTSSRAKRPMGITPTVRVTIPPKRAVTTFATCSALVSKFRDGVSAPGAVNTVTVKGRVISKPALGKPYVSQALYTANARLDVDRDRLVCEREPRP